VSNVLLSQDVADLTSDVGQVQELETMIRDILEELTKPNLSDLFPVLASLDLQGRRRRTAKRITRFFDFFDPIIKRRLNAGGEMKEDFLDVLLQLHSTDQLSIQTIKSFLLVCTIGPCILTLSTQKKRSNSEPYHPQLKICYFIICSLRVDQDSQALIYPDFLSKDFT
jgi:hypothetical protein